MPLYQYTCPCGRSEEAYRTIANRDDFPVCCGVIMRRVISVPMVAADIEPYRSMIDGHMVNSRSEHRTHLRDHGMVEVGNETNYLKPKPPPDPKGLKEALIRATFDEYRKR